MVGVVLFEDSHWHNFMPITLTKPTFDVKVGAKTYFEEYELAPEFLLTREYLAATTQERHPGSMVNPSSIDGDAVFVNGLLHPDALNLERLSSISHTFAVTSGSRLLVGRLGKKGGEYLTRCVETGRRINLKQIDFKRTTELGIHDAQGLLSNPWDIIIAMKNSLSMQVADSSESEGTPDGLKILGAGKVSVGSGVEIEDGVVLDATKGGIFIGAQARIAPSRIVGPTYIGPMTHVKQFTIIETSYIGNNCRVSGEIEHSVVSDFTNKGHTGFLGHSYVGEWVNIGAMTTTSDLKMTYGNIKMESEPSKKVDTGTNKVGSFIGDMSKTSIGTLIYSGRRIGASAHLHGLVAEDVPSFSIYGSSIGSTNKELELESALETQRRMMSRRNQKMSSAYVQMMKDLFFTTAAERKKSKIRKGKFSL